MTHNKVKNQFSRIQFFRLGKLLEVRVRLSGELR